MADIFNRLQFVKHEEIFPTREDAVNYVLDIQPITRPSLLGEPMILLYESGSVAKGPNVILAIGSAGDGETHTNANKTFFIDTQKAEDEIEELWEYIEQAIKSLTIVPVDSDTIDISSEKTSDGTLLSGDVKIADYRIISGNVVNNIIEVEGNKGIYTFVDMDYDPETFVITFRTTKETKEFQLPPDQHVVKGWYSTDDEAIYLKLADDSKIKVDVVKLIDEWTVLSGASSTPICLYKEHVSSSTEPHDGVYDWQDILTADVRVADHIDDNIIHKDRTGRFLYVKGTADNIMYRDGKTVQEALDTIDTRVSTSTGNIIYKRPDGIYAYAMLDYNTAENKLIYTYSDGSNSGLTEVEFKLNSVKILEDITYDPVREMIVIRYIDAQGEYQRVEIPVKDIIEEWEVNNEGHNIQLNKYRSEGQGKDILSADVKIHNGDNNILEDKDHTLYVNGIASNIKYDATGNTTVKNAIDQEVARAESAETALNEALISESQRANNAEQALDEKINQEIADRNANVERIDATIGSGFSTDSHETVTYKFNELNDKIDSEIERSESEDNRIDTKLDNEINRSTAKDTEHDNAISRIDTEIGSGFSTDVHETVTYKFNELQSQVNSESNKLQNEISRSTAKDTEHDGRLDAVDAEIGDGFGPRNTVRDEIDNLQDELDAVSSDTSMRLTDVINEDESIDVETRNDSNGNPTVKVVKVNLSTEVEDNRNNIIKLNSDGLFANVDLSYEKTANKLIFHTSNGQPDKEIQLDSISSIVDIQYIPSLEAIRITYMTNGHEIKTVDIPVGDLIREWQPSENTNGAVKLTLTSAPSGTTDKDILYAEVLLSNHDDNILINDGGSLYVSNSGITANVEAIEELESRMDAAESGIDTLQDDLREEISARTLADNALGERINQEIEDRIADVNAEETRAISAETALQTAINNEVTRATNAENALDSSLTARINETATSLSAYTQTSVNDEKTRAMTAEGELRQAIQDETARANAADQLLQDAIDDEVSRSTAKDNEHDIKIAALEASATTLNSNIISERTRAISAETALQTAINNEVTRATNAENTLDSSLTARINETATSLSAYTQTSVNDEKTRAMTAEGELRQAIQDETARANAADQLLQDAIDDEVSRSTAKDNEHDTKIAALETSATTLNSNIISERTRAISAETALQTAINNEVTRATNEESRIETKLDNEINRSISADTKLNNDIVVESARATAAENSLSNSATTNANNIVAEATRASSAETALQNAIDRETSRAINAETMVNHMLVDETNRAISAETALSNAITSETQARQEAIDDIIDRIDSVTTEFSDTNSIDFSTTSAATGNVVTAGVKLREGNNIIKCGNNGLYATVDLSYDPGTNKIKVVTSNGDGTEIQLVGASLLENLEFDETSKRLIITYKDATGEEHVVSFDVADLFNDWVVDQPSCVAIELTKVNGTSGQPDKLSGKVKISSSSDNALQIIDNSLFVSKSSAEETEEMARCTRNELYSFEKAVMGHRIDVECGSGYTYEKNTMATYINTASSFNNADLILDTNVKRVEDKVDAASTSAVCIDSKTNKLYELLVGTGSTMQPCGEGTIYTPDLGSCVISAATSFMEADRMLGDQICEILEMWQSGMTCTSTSDWVDDGANKRLEVDVRVSHGNIAGQDDDELVITDFIGDYIDPTRTEFTDTNALRIVCLQTGESGSTPDVKSLQNGLYLSNVWDCGLYYGSSDTTAKTNARNAGYIVDPYSTDETSSAHDYNYNNNVRQ